MHANPDAPTTVIHVRDMDPSRGDIYIGRAVPRRGLRQSPYANPFRVEPGLDREDAVILFRQWVTTSPDPGAAYIREHVHELRGRRLACWCHPKPCHGTVLAELADEGA